MKITIREIKQYVRDELECPAEFIKHIARCGMFKQLQDVIAEGDRRTEYDLMLEIWDEYKSYYRYAELDIEQDNRKARVGFFINC